MRPKFILYILILLGVSFLNLVPEHILSEPNARMIQYAVYCVLIVLWSVSAGKRITNRSIRLMQKTVVVCFVLIMLLGRLRIVAFAGVYPYEHLLWYMYYIPNLAIPLLSWYMTMYVGQDESYRLPVPVKLAMIPYALIVLVILTNEYHQLAFRLPDRGHAISVSGDYSLALFYYIAQIWLFGFALLSLYTLYRKYRVNNLRVQVLPFLALFAVGLLYTVLYAFDRSSTGFGFIEPDVMSCFPAMGLWELCINMRLIPSNSGYNRWFGACTIPMVICDKNDEIRFSSAGYEAQGDKGKDTGASESPTYVTRSFPVAGGSVRWSEDITRFREVIGQLEKNASLLAASNEKLAAQNRMQMQTIKAKEQIKLYDRSLGETGDRLFEMRTLLESCGTELLNAEDDERLRIMLGRISVIGAYVKRRSNLVLLAARSEKLPLSELHFCLRESGEALVLVPVSMIYKNEADVSLLMDAPEIMRVYDDFQEETEAVLDDLDYMRITLETETSPSMLRLNYGGERMEEKDINICFEPERASV